MATINPADQKKASPSLSTFVANAFYDVLIQDDDHISEYTYKKNWSRNVQEV